MNWMEVALLIFGAGALAASFIIPAKSEKADEAWQVDEELIRSVIEKEMADAKDRVAEVVDETLDYAVEKTERSCERVSNEKIMAISEYSETVLADINKSHQEVLFLYDMLNDKHDNLKETIKHVDRTAKEAEEAANAAAIALSAKAKEGAKAKEKMDAETVRQEEFERAALDKEAREKEYARRQMARLILPVQRELPTHRIGEMKAIPLKQDTNTAVSGKDEKPVELRPLIVKSVEIVNSKDMQPVPETLHADPVSTSDLQTLGSRPEDMKVVDVKPADIRPVEVYSFAEQAPRVERPVKKDKQAATFENSENLMKQQEHPMQSLNPVEESKENNNDRILRLHKEGFSNVDIAKELGLGVGEVKLVINLFKGAV